MTPLSRFPLTAALRVLPLFLLLCPPRPSHAAGTGRAGAYPAVRDSGLMTYLFRVNKIIMPVNAWGVHANVRVDTVSSGCYETPLQQFLFSGGFMLTGRDGNRVWANGVASASRIHDYVPGRTRNDSSDRPGIYVLDRSDPPFGTSWQRWRRAVAMGADFYDGDGNGVYDPVDLNRNGRWDPGEDAPDILGDHTAWSVIADKGSIRRWTDQTPVGIDVQTTIFAYRGFAGPLASVLFVRYRIVNRGTVADLLDSVYFSAWADADIGASEMDYSGCDRELEAGYTYNDSADAEYGSTPPAHMMPLLQGAVVPTGRPGDTATVYRGPLLGVRRIPGARNLGMTSFTQYISSNPNRGDPTVALQARCYMTGFGQYGAMVNPCTDFFGRVMGGQRCDTIPPWWWYSGDPVSMTGWIHTVRGDVRQMQNTGPFDLTRDQPVDIITAYVVGRGTDARNSITVARANVAAARQALRSNFVTEAAEEPAPRPQAIVLEQNYPNPFNPATTIRFALPEPSRVSLVVYDLLGRAVETLIDESREAGYHTVRWNASGRSSGIYFIRLRAGGTSSSRSMLLLR